MDNYVSEHKGEVNVFLGLRNTYKWSSATSSSISSIQLTFYGLPGWRFPHLTFSANSSVIEITQRKTIRNILSQIIWVSAELLSTVWWNRSLGLDYDNSNEYILEGVHLCTECFNAMTYKVYVYILEDSSYNRDRLFGNRHQS